MNHFVQRFAELKTGLADMAGLRIDMPIATRPIRAAEPGICEAHPCAQYDDCRGE